MAVFGQNNPLKENIQNSSIKVQKSTRIDAFCQNFMLICPVTKKCDFIVSVTKNMHKHALFRRHFAPLLPQVPKFLTREI